MSKVGKQVLTIPSGVTVAVSGDTVTVRGKLGEIKRNFDSSKVEIVVEGDRVSFKKKGDSRMASKLWGTWASHIKNMIKGVSEGFTKQLLIEGVGYKWEVAGKDLKLALGFSHPVFVKIPEGLTLKVDKNALDIFGFDKELVGSFAMRIRKLKLPEPYKGKGIRYANEVIRRKQGKRAV